VVIVVMGVSGAGKTTVGRLLASELGWPFHDADDLHSAANVERMAGGLPLTDEHRKPWLAALADLVAEFTDHDRSMVLACSALRRAHREALLAKTTRPQDVRLVHLTAGSTLLARRLAQRPGHFFPAELLETQLAELEAPAATERVLVLDATLPADELVATIRSELGL
jgi:gluconokinase